MTLGPGWLPERWRRKDVEYDVDDELAFHIEMRAQIYEAAGMDASTARDRALRRFGDLAEVRDRCLAITRRRERRMRRLELLTALRADARYALRRLRAAPGFAAAVLLMLCLGVGATTTVFSIVDGVLLRPLPFPHPEQLVAISHTIQVAGVQTVDQSEATFLFYQRHASSFENIGVSRSRSVNLASPTGAGDPERVGAASVSASFLPTLGIAPLHGRGFVAGEDRTGAAPVVILSEGLWRRAFGGDPAVVGRRITIDGAPREVVGIMADRFRYPSASTELWMPIPFDPATATLGSFNYEAVARLKPGMTREMANAQLTQVLPNVIDEFPGDIPKPMFVEARLRPRVIPLRDVVVGDVGRLLWILFGAVTLVLLVACANVASLFLVRAEGSRRELAVRTALGAGSAALVAQYLSEGLLLAVGGGIGGVAMAFVGVRAVAALPNGMALPRTSEVSVDGTVLLFAALVTIFTAIAVSVLPVLRSRRLSIATVLRGAGRAATEGADRQRARSALVVAQVALALVLVAGSALMARSFARLRDVQPGFDPRDVVTLRVALPAARYRDASSRMQFHDRVLASVRGLAGVRAAAITDWVPLSGDNSNSVVELEDRPLPPNAVPPSHDIVYASPTLFATMGIPLLAGRTFGPQDATRPLSEAIVTHAFAERYWKGQNAVGKRLRIGIAGGWQTVVGVVGDVHLHGLERPAESAVYFPLVTVEGDTVSVPGAIALTVRGSGDPAALTAAVRRAVRSIDPTLPTYGEVTMGAVLASATARTRFTMLMLGAASLIALVLGATGIYGVMAYGVTLRRREIGVRMALGARAADMSRMISRSGVVLAAAGVAIGLVGTLVTTRFLRGLLFDVSPTDPLTLISTSVVLLGIALVASWLPARRAAAVDPMEALRRE
jgi:predicted permease